MSKHTPGPWEHVADLIWAPGVKANVAAVSVLRATDHVAYTAPDFGERDREEIYANARLIAAAPDLLEAIKPLMRPGCGEPDCACGPSSKALRAAEAAVKKAEGK